MKNEPRKTSRMASLCFRNTHLQSASWLYTAVDALRDFDAALKVNDMASPAGPALQVNISIRRYIWFWPRVSRTDSVARSSTQQAWPPFHHLHAGSWRLVNDLLSVGPGALPQLGIGGGSGSDVATSSQAGYSNVTAVPSAKVALELTEATDAESGTIPDAQRIVTFRTTGEDIRLNPVRADGVTTKNTQPRLLPIEVQHRGSEQ